MQSLTEDQLQSIGFISKPHGFHGELIFALEDGEAEEFAGTVFFFIELEGKPVPFFVENIKMKGQSMIVKLEDINTEVEAKAVSGKKIFALKKKSAPVAREPEWNDLIGYTVFEKEYGKLGPLERIDEYPQQIIGQCIIHGKEVLFPLHEDMITDIDEKKKELHIDLPEGLLALYLD